MNEEGHIGLALLLLSPATYFLLVNGTEEVVASVFFLTAVFTCTLPDLDIKLQRITGKNGIPILRSIVSIKHRGILHTIYFAVFMGSLMAAASLLLTSNMNIIQWSFIGGFVGVCLHLLGDIVTPTGLDVLPPITKNRSLNLFNFNNLFGNLGSAMLGMASFILFLMLFSNQVPDARQSILYAIIVVYLLAPIFLLLASKLEWRYDRNFGYLTAPFTLSFWLGLIR